ncbi:hypothetical protein [Streptomyces sp. B6B3]|uniref:tetratricopeptide repeat protein n=1 Tax=Streptomyces sp. B6B3 TaxID=3153570 RepID=UPI00325E3868
MTVNVDFDPRARRRRGLTAVLLNGTGWGLGFVYLRLWGKAVRYWIATVLLIVLANALNASGTPVVWLVVYALWLLGAMFSGWRHGIRGETAIIRAPAYAPVVGAVVLALVAAGLVFYRATPAGELDTADAAHADGDCAEASDHYERASASQYEFLLTPVLAEARDGLAACELLLVSERAAERGDYAAALGGYEEYLAGYDGAPPFADAATRVPGLRLESADAVAERAAEADSWEGDDGYLTAIEAYFQLRADYPDSPEAGHVEERVRGIYDARTAPLADQRYCQVTDALEQFAGLADQFDEPEARDLGEQANGALPEAHYGCASAHQDNDEPCQAAPEFEAAATAPAASERMADRAGSALRETLFDCGEARYQAGSYPEARDVLQRLLDDYPDDAHAGEAEDMLISIDIAEISEDSSTGELPDPDQSGSGAAGVATVEIENGSSETLEILYTGPETGRTTIDACSGCTATLSLSPGDYEVVARASSDASVTPFYGTWELNSGYEYSNYFYITFF